MKFPNFKEEKKLKKKGFRVIAGLDEAGRGPLAGPVMAAAVIIRKFATSNPQFLEIKDSKKISPPKREILYNFLTKNSNIEWATGKVSEKIIDKINILEATKLAMKKAVINLDNKLKLTDNRKNIDFLILDGNMEINCLIPQKAIKKADNKVFSCAAASIIAKVKRDRLMKRYHKKYFEYGFNAHKGYATKLHREMLEKYGPCKIHRKTFKPVKDTLSK
ncbi:ribonuclease HII [Parcubacteria bacterium DG_74_3]|nr:MAG: ribonuclease HII [Parcubacteria bacterium DG_74_3]